MLLLGCLTDDFQPQKALLQTAKCLHFLVSFQNAFTFTNFKFLSFKRQPWWSVKQLSWNSHWFSGH